MMGSRSHESHAPSLHCPEGAAVCVVRRKSSHRYTCLQGRPANTCVYLHRGSDDEFHRPVSIESSSTLNQPQINPRASKSSIVIVSVDDLPLSSSTTRAGEESSSASPPGFAHHPRPTPAQPTHPRPAETDVVLSSAAPAPVSISSFLLPHRPRSPWSDCKTRSTATRRPAMDFKPTLASLNPSPLTLLDSALPHSSS
jgi:hypothetical protein